MTFTLFEGNALDAYPSWDTPTTIISDGAYGVKGFPGDPGSVRGLVDWYRPHIAAWSEAVVLGNGTVLGDGSP
jgi:site-specific DNA-methyltransferase (adenine-specific)